MTKVIGKNYPAATYVVNAADLAYNGALATGPVAGYIKLDTLPAGAVVVYAEWVVNTAVAGVTTATARLVTADTGTTNNQTNYGVATDAKSTSTDVQTTTPTVESKLVARDLLLRIALATGSEAATSITAGQITVYVNYFVLGN